MSLKHVAAMLLCHYAGTPITVDALQKVLGAIGGDLDKTVAQKLIDAVENKDVAELLADGMSKLASVPAGGPVAATSGGAPVPAGEAPAEKEEEKKEEEEEEDDDMGFGLFD
eukprot:Protomagalhaensia_sp_Gyna_25__1909@NODE_2011_length_1349_cov_325_606107_g1658_i0_p2_GENE_NODE_2011_length_1349_cov_325_606107_g1658_i0NODE_2011_length_1349_cov_325_606107_g1658_i0_p2_ORF_typecomplete_len112_score36_68Ribosomal_60s/PF00428_19/3_9e24_NODE_2011_length_1349_cov_325_606107_g1658_i09571292